MSLWFSFWAEELGQQVERNVRCGSVINDIVLREWKAITVAIWIKEHFLKELELLSENINLLDGKWEKILAENRLFDKHYSMALGDLFRQ